jgi:hypothetical protein
VALGTEIGFARFHCAENISLGSALEVPQTSLVTASKYVSPERPVISQVKFLYGLSASLGVGIQGCSPRGRIHDWPGISIMQHHFKATTYRLR